MHGKTNGLISSWRYEEPGPRGKHLSMALSLAPASTNTVCAVRRVLSPSTVKGGQLANLFQRHSPDPNQNADIEAQVAV